MQKLLLITLVASTLAACTNEQASTDTSEFDAALDLAAQQIDEVSLMERIRTLSSDEFEGRAPSTPGGKKTVEFIEQEMKNIGLEPAFGSAEDASYRQPVELIEQMVTNSPSIVVEYADGTTDELVYAENSVSFTAKTSEATGLENSQLVFVGYGVVAPEYGWNDYEGVDMAGKTAVILVNDPGYRAASPDLFKGKTMTYYGRWTYKFEEAARQGAAGAIVIHETGAAGYGWDVVAGSWSGAQYMLYSADGSTDASDVSAWMSMDAAQNLFSKNGMDYTAMVERAGIQGFKAISLETSVSTSLEMTSKRSVSYNVAGKIAGKSASDEAFIYTAHWDHLGVKASVDGEDKIFNGAQDNATGTAGLLEMAEAFKALPESPDRSVVFLAVTAEESGLLGSKYYGENPAVPMNKTVAGINTDAIQTFGATDDIVVVGYGNSEMDKYLAEVAADQGRVLVQEPTPEKGFFYRSDHFNLAKKGVPMLYAKAGTQVRGKDADYGSTESARYISERYHKPGDEIHADWDNGAIMQDLEANFKLGAKLSNSDIWPAWAEGNEFKAIRDASLAE